MKRTLFALLLLASSLFAEVVNVTATSKFIKTTEMKIIDIRTEAEWKQMGIINGAYLITFFDEKYDYNVHVFLNKLNEVIDKDEKFAIICNTGSRTKLVSNFLGNKHDYRVVNLIGGMSNLIKEGFELDIYNPSSRKKLKRKGRFQFFSDKSKSK